jgi:hypothetical protein
MEEQRVRIPRHLTIYFVATVALWTVALFTGRCWMWQNEQANCAPEAITRHTANIAPERDQQVTAFQTANHDGRIGCEPNTAASSWSA